MVWITGASSGIGEHLAYAFSNAGSKLVLSSRSEEDLKRVAQNCGPEAQTLVLPLDMTDFELMEAKCREVIDHFGRIDILVNNAGISQRALAADTLLEVDRKIMDVNFVGTVALTKGVLPHMLERSSGHIVVMSSVMGKFAAPYRSAYCASKHALHGFFDALRAEVHENGIHVTLICPGYVHTNVTINALTGDGSKNDEMAASTAGGLEPHVFAEKALSAIRKEKAEVIIGGKETMGVYLKRFLPGVLRRVLRNIELR